MTEGPARLVETHSAVVVFVGDRVYKVKKPVRLPFLDFSTPSARAAACAEEVALNRRLAPDVYLGVGQLTQPGRAPESVVVTRRLPEDRKLAALVTSHADVSDELRRLARRIAAFHSTADSSPQTAAAGSPAAVRELWEASFAQVAPYLGSVLDVAVEERIERLARDYLAGREPLLTRRVATGRIRDGHGDLLADDIFCLPDGPRILDCIEFDPALRHGDVVLDVAFLAMDLERLGAPSAAETLWRCYRQFSAETHPVSLADFYVAYRAHVRAKVACVRWEQGEPPAAGAARQLLDLALRHLEAARPRLVLIGGLPGTGKTTLAAAATDRLDWTLIRSDVVRKQLAGVPEQSPAVAEFREGIYSDSATARTYREMVQRARQALALGESVVLDASWTDGRWRGLARQAADATASELVEVCCVAPPAVAAERLALRSAAGLDASDATSDIAELLAQHADPWPTAYEIDTAPPVGAILGGLLARITAAPDLRPHPELLPG